MDFRKLIRTYDKENTLFYCDPPFVAEKYRRYYRHNFEHKDMQELLELLRDIKGKWILKLTYRNLKYDYINNFAKNYAIRVLNVGVGGKRKEEGRIVLIHNVSGLDTWIKT
jgi:DNA adenine methylase